MTNDAGRTQIGNTPEEFDRKTAERLLERIQKAQDEFWNALGAFEEETGYELDSTTDYRGYDLDSLIEFIA